MTNQQELPAKTISLCITTYNRAKETIRAFRDVLDDNRISEIIISDDHSLPGYKSDLITQIKKLNNDKIFFENNARNLGCYKNKAHSVSIAFNEHVIVFDSDNRITPDYIDTLYTLDWSSASVFMPSFAKPHFDYRHLVGTYNRENLFTLVNKPQAFTLLNTMNFFCNRKDYLSAFKENVEPLNADSLFINYNLLKAGKTITVVPGLEYDHDVHSGSHYKQHERKGARLVRTMERNLKLLANGLRNV